MLLKISPARVGLSMFFLLSFLANQNVFAQKTSLKTKTRQIILTSKGKVGVSVAGLEDDFKLNVNDDQRYPMQSVFKFPLALAVLDGVDRGNFTLDQTIHVTKADLLPNTWSPLRDAFPDGTDIPLSDLLAYTVSKSDNNGCDILFRLMGGTGAVNDYIHRLGVKNITIAATEAEMARAWNVQYTNWCRPSAMINLLKRFYDGKILSKTSGDFLMKIMTETSTGPKRLKGLLPAGSVVAHKTGTSGTSERGVTAATNDAGIVTLPDGRHYAIVVYLSDSTAGEDARESVVAQINKAVWDSYPPKR